MRDSPWPWTIPDCLRNGMIFSTPDCHAWMVTTWQGESLLIKHHIYSPWFFWGSPKNHGVDLHSFGTSCFDSSFVGKSTHCPYFKSLWRFGLWTEMICCDTQWYHPKLSQINNVWLTFWSAKMVKSHREKNGPSIRSEMPNFQSLQTNDEGPAPANHPRGELCSVSGDWRLL